MNDDLASRVLAARSGDREAFGVLYQHFGRMVHGILLAHGPREEAEDLVQEVFLRAWTQLRTLHEPAAFGGWLARMARNRATDALRTRRTMTPIDPGLAAAESPYAETIAVVNLVRAL